MTTTVEPRNATQKVWDEQRGREVPICDDCADRIEWREEASRFDGSHPRPLIRTARRDGKPILCVFERHPKPKARYCEQCGDYH